MYYRLSEYTNGDYVGADGKRYHLSECNIALTPNGVNYGYSEFASKDECLAAWNITYDPLPAPVRSAEDSSL